jgi:hypothetical protein
VRNITLGANVEGLEVLENTGHGKYNIVANSEGLEVLENTGRGKYNFMGKF